MAGRRIRALVLVSMLLATGQFGGSSGVAATQSAECVQLAWYAGEMTAAGEQIDEEEASGPDMERVDTWSAADFEAALAIYDRFLIMFQGIQPPPMAADYHQTFIEGIELLREMLETMQSSGIFAMLGYLEPIAELNQQLAALALPLEESCQIALFDHDEDGVLEVGAGNAPASPEAGGSEVPETPVADGSRVEPVAVGTAAMLDGQWELTVLSVTPDATAEVLAYDPSNTAPADGVQYFIARVKITNAGTEEDSFNNWRLTLEDPSNRIYVPFIDSCGFIPDELSSDTLAPGESAEGNVCWAIPSAEAGSTASLVIYDGDAFESDRIYFSLDAQDESNTDGLS
jgi:hypothetical protein